MSKLLALPKGCIQATFISRPQRFLAKVMLPSLKSTLVYCSNPGSMTGCIQAGCSVLVWDSKNVRRKRRFTWKAIKIKNVWVGTDTHVSNQLVERCIVEGVIASLTNYTIIRREPTVARGSRVDFLLQCKGKLCWVEVKSAFIVENGVARFPDSISPRALRQLQNLTKKAKRGDRALIVFVTQRSDAASFTINQERYPEYSSILSDAIKAGVEVVALSFPMTRKGYSFPRQLPFII